MNAVFELVTFDKKKTKFIKYIMSSLMPMFALTLILKRVDNQILVIIGFFVCLSIVLLAIISFFFLKPYKKNGTIIINKNSLKIQEDETVIEFKLSEIKKMDIEYLTGKKGEKRPRITQYNRNVIKIKDQNNNENSYTFLIDNELSAKNIFELENILNETYNSIRVRNVYGQNG